MTVMAGVNSSFSSRLAKIMVLSYGQTEIFTGLFSSLGEIYYCINAARSSPERLWIIFVHLEIWSAGILNVIFSSIGLHDLWP